LGIRRAILKTDSQVISGHIDKSSKARDPKLEKYLDTVRRLEASFEGFSVKNIPRGENEHADLSTFRPRGVPGPTSKLSLRAPAQMGRHETEHKEGKTAAPCCPAPRVDALAVGGYKRSRGRGRESLSASPSSRAATFSYEGPGPSFYRCKERVQVYNGGCSNMLTCPAERSQSPMYMPTWLSERC
jgi:hypothetical protein